MSERIIVKEKISVVKKGEVYWYRVSKRETEGTELMKTRLGVIFSTDFLNRWKKRFVIIPLTSKKTEKIYHYEAPTLVGNVKGKVLLDQIRTINKSRLLKYEGKLTKEEMKEIYAKFMELFNIWDYLEEEDYF
ncbi:MAG: type II toxin-antitoxin system PemK/MazF family toxin [Candidatus Moeniiplasma glomeromycotorum]|nr:type II toxin-antitoxin system PemK/MazF family toxin [Candidatus Moeniiplasma glomeromycotorum]MCE8167286.1 type II toxin-antitoxin system PemK/MazF family toxin [Candidatus Moeniiplasma glomeromycotorum]MCE8168701.1 type II toxin-antitoxin system PemK/MazF family toxin [Candidatus Moeniiplasma glomeromycotorum]